VFVIDPKGVLRAMIYYRSPPGDNMDEILRLVDALQTADTNGVAYARPIGRPARR